MRYSLLALCVAAAACGGTAATTTTTPATTTTTSPSTTTTTMPTTSTTLPDLSVLPLATDEMPETWVEAFFIPYGETRETLGTSLGGDGGGIMWGPEYGAQAPDGTWWFLDTANFRLAHFSAAGEFLDDVAVPADLLVQGIYFQYTQPRVLDDGTLLASRVGGEGTVFIRLRDGVLDSFSIPYAMSSRADDGALMYGFSFGEDSSLIAVDPVAGTAEEVEWMVRRDGARFRVSGGAGGLGVELPDQGKTLQFDFEAAEVGGAVHVGVEVATAEDGTMHLFILGFPEVNERLQLAGYMTLSPDGEVTAFEPMMDPFTPSDPGTPARLGVRPRTSHPWIMNIGVDGVRVYSRG